MKTFPAAVIALTSLLDAGHALGAQDADWFHKQKPARQKKICATLPDFPYCSPTVNAAKNEPPPPPRIPIKPVNDNRPFLFRDRSDVFAFTSPSAADATIVPGASISFLDDLRTKTQSLNVQGILGYSIPNVASFTLPGASAPTAIGLSPNIYVLGTLTEPRRATEVNAIRASLDVQTVIDAFPFSHAFDVAPYFQTDFRGIAKIGGISAVYEPVNVDLHLGALSDLSPANPQLAAYFIRVLPEIDYNYVENAGLTRFRSHAENAFIGGTLQVRSVLLPNNDVFGKAFCGRIYVNGTAQYFENLVTGRSLSNYIAEMGYYLSDGVSKYNWGCFPRDENGQPPVPSAAATSSAISVVYTDGTDKTTLLKQRQYRVQLNFRY